MVDRRLIQDPQWVRDFELPDYLRELPGTARRRMSSLLDEATVAIGRFIDVTEDGAIRTWDRVKTLRIPTMTQLTQTLPKLKSLKPALPARTTEVAVPTASHPETAERSLPSFVTEKFLTGAIIAASVVLILFALRTTQMVAIHVIEFLAQTVNTFLTRLGFPPAL